MKVLFSILIAIMITSCNPSSNHGSGSGSGNGNSKPDPQSSHFCENKINHNQNLVEIALLANKLREDCNIDEDDLLDLI